DLSTEAALPPCNRTVFLGFAEGTGAFSIGVASSECAPVDGRASGTGASWAGGGVTSGGPAQLISGTGAFPGRRGVCAQLGQHVASMAQRAAGFPMSRMTFILKERGSSRWVARRLSTLINQGYGPEIQFAAGVIRKASPTRTRMIPPSQPYAPAHL